MPILDRIFRDIKESRQGKIRVLHNMWAVIGSRWDKNRIESAGVNHFTQNRLGVLVRKQCTPRCPNPPIDDAYGGDDRWNVPMSECRKCPHHRKSVRGSRFPKCSLLAVSNPDKAAALETLDMLKRAAEKANDIMRG